METSPFVDPQLYKTGCFEPWLPWLTWNHWISATKSTVLFRWPLVQIWITPVGFGKTRKKGPHVGPATIKHRVVKRSRSALYLENDFCCPLKCLLYSVVLCVETGRLWKSHTCILKQGGCVAQVILKVEVGLWNQRLLMLMDTSLLHMKSIVNTRSVMLLLHGGRKILSLM